jgi:XTP/dITP diphosphohydrolase
MTRRTSTCCWRNWQMWQTIAGPLTSPAALAWPGGAGAPAAELLVEGRLQGTLLRQRRGLGGFGYDPIFLPEGFDRTTAEMSAPEKDAISHRGRAFRELSARM